MWDLFVAGLLLLVIDGIRVLFATLIGWIISLAMPKSIRSRRFNEITPFKLLLYFIIGAIALSAFWAALGSSLTA